MRIIISLILLILKTINANAATETIICYGKEETYNCVKYDGNDPDMYEYNRHYQRISINVHEFSDAGTRNPNAPADSESGRLDPSDEKKDYDPVFIPYSPFFFFSGNGK